MSENFICQPNGGRHFLTDSVALLLYDEGVDVWPSYYNGDWAACLLYMDNMTGEELERLNKKHDVKIMAGGNPVVLLMQM